MRDTGFPQAVRDMAHHRSGGVCEAMIPMVCTGRVEVLHHRRPRAIGGTRRPDANTASNALGLCDACHRWVESNRAEAMDKGFLVSQWASPGEVVVSYRSLSRIRLTDDGGYAVGGVA